MEKAETEWRRKPFPPIYLHAEKSLLVKKKNKTWQPLWNAERSMTEQREQNELFFNGFFIDRTSRCPNAGASYHLLVQFGELNGLFKLNFNLLVNWLVCKADQEINPCTFLGSTKELNVIGKGCG